MNRFFIGLVALFALIAGSLISVASPAVAQDGGSLTIHNRICPTNYEGETFFEDCHDTVPDPGLTFTLTNGVTQDGTTDAEGNVAFTGLQEDTYTIRGGVPGEFAEYVVFCSVGTGDGREPIEFEYVTGGIQITVPADTEIVCDWYNIPFDLSGEPTPTPTPDPYGETVPVTIYKIAGIPGYHGTDYFEDCYNNPVAGVEFFSPGPGAEDASSGVTGEDGFVTIEAEIVPWSVIQNGETRREGTAIIISEVTPSDTVDYVVVCSRNNQDDFLRVYLHPDEVQVTVRGPEPGDEIRCDWYNVPAAEPTPTPTPVVPTPTPTPVPEGYPAQIRTGECDDDEEGELVADLTDIVPPEGDMVGHEEAVVAAASLTVLSRSLDELLAEDHVVVVYPLDEPDDEPIACGAIGGILTTSGSLIIGLSEQNESGFTGIAFFEPVPDHPERTRVSLLMAEDLAVDEEEDEDAP